MVSDLIVEHLGCGVTGEAQGLAARDSSKASGAIDDEEAERLHTRDPVGIGAFARARLGCRDGRVQLKAAQQVVGEDRELLPGTIGAVVISGNHVESEFTLELSEGLLLRSATGAEVPQRLGREREIGGDGGVLEVAIVGRKQIELIILRALVMNPLAVDHHPQIELPRLKLKSGLEAADLGIDRGPLLLGSDQGLDPGPLAEGHLDGVEAASPSEQLEQILLEKCRVHAEFEW